MASGSSRNDEIEPLLPKHNDSINSLKKRKVQHKEVLVSRLEDELWFRGVLTEDETEQILEADGDFLVRKCNKDQRYYLSVYQLEPYHILLSCQQKYTLGRGNFGTIGELINHHHKQRESFTHDDVTIVLLCAKTRKEPLRYGKHSLKEKSWFLGNVTWNQAERLLTKEGDYFVREIRNETDSEYVLSVFNNRPRHVLIEREYYIIQGVRRQSIYGLVKLYMRGSAQIQIHSQTKKITLRKNIPCSTKFSQHIKWFHGTISREDAEKLLKKDGDFLVRRIPVIYNPTEYLHVLSFFWQKPRHIIIQHRYTLGNSRFRSIADIFDERKLFPLAEKSLLLKPGRVEGEPDRVEREPDRVEVEPGRVEGEPGRVEGEPGCGRLCCCFKEYPLLCGRAKLITEPWFFGQISKEKAETLLDNYNFLVREIPGDKGQYILSIKVTDNGAGCFEDDRYFHLFLERYEKKYHLGKQQFDSIPDLVERGRHVIKIEEAVLHLEVPKKIGCVSCRDKKQLTSFHRDILQPGDNIEVKGNMPLVGYLYRHHAIVSEVNNISEDGQTAEVWVIDVPAKKKSTWCCAENELQIQKHKLFDRANINCRELRRVDYRYRKHGHVVTLERANTYANTVIKECYCLCYRNCEHFTKACVSGDGAVCTVERENNDTRAFCCCCFIPFLQSCCSNNDNNADDDSNIRADDINNSTCDQSATLTWRSIHVVVALIQAIFYFINLCAFAIYVAKDNMFNIFDDRFFDWFRDHCFHPERKNIPGLFYFQTDCDWKGIGVLTGVSILLYMISFCRQYFCFYKKNYKCIQCLISALMVYVFEVVLFVVVEVGNIILERTLYNAIHGVNLHVAGTTVGILLMALIETILVFKLAAVCTVMCLFCLGKSCCRKVCCTSCKIEEYSYQYVKVIT